MARPKDNETRERIERAAFQLFSESGYTKTSYSAIANRCDMTKALVQYYFKKKEDLAFDLMAMTLEACVEDLGYCGADSPTGARYDELKRIGAEFFARILGPGGHRLFLVDVLASRELTESVLAFNAEWAFAYLGNPGGNLPQEALDAVVMSMGGFYELLYHTLKEGRAIDAPTLLARVVDDFEEAVRAAQGER